TAHLLPHMEVIRSNSARMLSFILQQNGLAATERRSAGLSLMPGSSTGHKEDIQDLQNRILLTTVYATELTQQALHLRQSFVFNYCVILVQHYLLTRHLISCKDLKRFICVLSVIMKTHKKLPSI